MSHWISTYTGRVFSLDRPSPEQVDIEDIARSLSKLCRFVGHCQEFYSVAQHSVLVSLCIEEEDLRLPALLHDAHEAYLGDVSRPLKALAALTAWDRIARRVDSAIARKFGLPHILFDHQLVKRADSRMLATEHRDIMLSSTPWVDQLEPYPIKITPWGPGMAYIRFMARFKQLSARALV